jgi:ribosome-binding protein aMBF1 (putative translation factor)
MPPNRKSKQPPPRPFPWRCNDCAKKSVEISHVSYDAQVRHDGRLHEFVVPKLEIPVCASCGTKVFTEAVDEQVNAALRIHLSLLSPEQIREALRRLGVTQKELASHLRIAEATLSRWVNATQIQSRSMDTLLRLYFGLQQVRHTLREPHADASLGLDVPHHA